MEGVGDAFSGNEMIAGSIVGITAIGVGGVESVSGAAAGGSFSSEWRTAGSGVAEES